MNHILSVIVWSEIIFFKIPPNVPNWGSERALRVTNQLRMGLVNTALLPTVLSPRRSFWKPGWQKGPILQLMGCTEGRCSGTAMCFVFPVGSFYPTPWLVVVSCCPYKMPCSPQGMHKHFNIPHWAIESMGGPIFLNVLWVSALTHKNRLLSAWNIATTTEWEFVGLHILWSELDDKWVH